MYLDYINEAFKSLDLLTENMFNTSPDGINKMSQFFDEDDDMETVRVIDKEASTEDDIQDSYIGKVIINCNVCHSHIYEDKENIVIAEEGFANLDDVCPYCGQQEGYTIVGEIAEFDSNDTPESTDTPEESPVETEVDVETDTVTEALDGGRKFKPHTMRLLKYIGSDLANNSKVVDESATAALAAAGTAALGTAAAAFGSRIGSGLADKILGDDLDTSKDKSQPISEDFKEVSITTDDQHLEMTSDESGKVTVVTEPVSDVLTGDESITPLTAETESEILANNELEDSSDLPPEDTEDNDEDVTLDELDETSFDELGESYLKEVYDNVARFKTVDVSADSHGMVLEGIITFNSGTRKRTRFMFEAADMNKKGQVRFKGTNSHLTESVDAYSLVGRIVNKKFISESLKYNYTTQGNAVRGVVRRK